MKKFYDEHGKLRHNFNQGQNCVQCGFTFEQARDPGTAMLNECIIPLPIDLGLTLQILGELLEEGIIEEVNRLDGKIGYRVIKEVNE